MNANRQERLRIAVGFATAGRCQSLGYAINCIRMQTRAPDWLFVCATDPRDIVGITFDDAITTRLFAERGLTRQRNAILGQASDFDILAFFDDDFVAHPTYLSAIEEVFNTNPDVAMVTGHVLADGVIGPGLSAGEALRVLAEARVDRGATAQLVEVYNGYGCNMCVRLSAIFSGRVEFDEALPLYGWLEDVDFSRRLARYGRIVKSQRACGVHLGLKSGRQSGTRLGYSQIANPIYLVRKGSFGWSRAVYQMARNVGMNVIHSFWPEPYIDRRGRLRGNVLAVTDLVKDKLRPERALLIDDLSPRASQVGELQ